MTRITLILGALALLSSTGCKSKPAAPAVDTSLPAAFRAGAPARYPLPEAKVGWGLKVSQEVTSGDTTSKSWTTLAVVAETEETLTLELELSAHEGYVELLEVSKADGTVKRAALAQLEGESKKLKLLKGGALTQGEVESLTVKAGEFKVRKQSGQGVTLWTASEGEVAGATIKEEAPQKRELVRVGSKEPLEISGRRLDPRVLTYDDESRVWWSEDALIRALNGGRVRTQREGFKSAVVSVTTQAKARAEWPGAKPSQSKTGEGKTGEGKTGESKTGGKE